MGNNLVLESKKGSCKIDLSNQKISELPTDQVEFLTKLEQLNLNDNLLTEIPFQITYLSNLQILTLKSNSLKEFPEALCHMQRLKVLDISKNQIKTLPENLGKLPYTLEVLSISNNRIQRIPSSFSKLNKLQMLKLENNPIKYPPPEIINCPNEMEHIDWINRLKDFLKQDANNNNQNIPENNSRLNHINNLEAASINDCDILCDTYFHNVSRFNQNMDKLDPWMYHFVESVRNLTYAIAQLCRAIKQYSPATGEQNINELFEKEYGDVNCKVCQIIYSLDRFDRGISEESIHRSLCSDLKLIVMTTIPDVKNLLKSIQNNIKVLMDKTNIRVSRNFLFTCHSVIVEVHAATESVLMAIPSSERNLNLISTSMTRSSSSVSMQSLKNHKYSNSKSSINSFVNSKSANTSSSSNAIPNDINDIASTTTSIAAAPASKSQIGGIPINGTSSRNNSGIIKASLSSSLNDLSTPISISQNSSIRNLYQNGSSELVAEPSNITGTSLTDSYLGSMDTLESGNGSYNENIKKSFNMSQTTADNTESSSSTIKLYTISKQKTPTGNALNVPSQLSQKLSIESKIHPRKDSLNKLTVNSNTNEERLSFINTKNLSGSRSPIVSPSIATTPTPGNINKEANSIVNSQTNSNDNISGISIEKHSRHLSDSSSVAIVGDPTMEENENDINTDLQSMAPSTNQTITSSQSSMPISNMNMNGMGIPMNMNNMNMNMNMHMNMNMNMNMPIPTMTAIPGMPTLTAIPGMPTMAAMPGMPGMPGMSTMAAMNAIPAIPSIPMRMNPMNAINIRNDDTVSVYSASSLHSALHMTIVPQPTIPSAPHFNNLQNLSLTYELKEFNFPLEEQFFLLSFNSLRASYNCLDILKLTFDAMKASPAVIENQDIYQLILECSGPQMDNTRMIVDNYYEKFLNCVNYTIDGNGNGNGTTDISSDVNVSLIPIDSIILNSTNVINPNSTSEDHRTIYEESIDYIHGLIQCTIIIREMTQRITFNSTVIISLQNVTKSAKNLIKFCSK